MAAFFVDFALLYFLRKTISGRRQMNERFSNGDLNKISLTLVNHYPINLNAQVIEEIPFQFGELDISCSTKLEKKQPVEIEYELRPVERGEYTFGYINVLVATPLSLIRRRFKCAEEDKIKVYPSYQQLRKFEILAATNRLTEYGVKQIRKTGQNTEFENIRDYTQGDDIRTINWKASARRNNLMINEYQDERSQPIYCIIDKGRSMKMPFNQMTLLDHAINSALIFLSVALQKKDKAGLITFSNKIGSVVKADSKTFQMQLILENLYKQETRFFESDFERLYKIMHQNLRQRSLIMLYSNFESLVGLRRQLKYLKRLAKDHILVIVFFENVEMSSIGHQEVEDIDGLYLKMTAEKYTYEKKMIVKELQLHGIHSLLTTPENLTVDSINKYLEIKSRGLI